MHYLARPAKGITSFLFSPFTLENHARNCDEKQKQKRPHYFEKSFKIDQHHEPHGCDEQAQTHNRDN
jgi:hypothetical protein